MERVEAASTCINIENPVKEVEESTLSALRPLSFTFDHWVWDVIIYYRYIKTKYRNQILFCCSLYGFSVWIFKLYEDIGQAIEYNNDANIVYFVVSVLMLILPTAMCTLYLLITQLIDTRCSPKRKDIIVPLINGLLLIPWQVKQCLDALHYSAQRICLLVWSVYEKETVFSMGINCDLLEFFEDMFSGFLGICLQLYIFLVNQGWTGEQVEETKLMTGEIIGSILSLLSMLEAIKRRDDRLLTNSCVRLGWIFMFISRALAICLATTIIKFWIIVFILAHTVIINSWVFYIAKQSYIDIIMKDMNAIIDWKVGFGRGRLLLWLLSYIIYGLPSVIYWPLMFQMKDSHRTEIFLSVILIENICLGSIWTFGVYFHQITVISLNEIIIMNSAILGLTLFSIFWIRYYLHLKPYYVDKNVLLDILKEDKEAQQECAADYGVSYIFYSKVFPIPSINQLWKSMPPYCNEDRLLFNLGGSSTEESDEDEDEKKDKKSIVNTETNKMISKIDTNLIDKNEGGDDGTDDCCSSIGEIDGEINDEADDEADSDSDDTVNTSRYNSKHIHSKRLSFNDSD